MRLYDHTSNGERLRNIARESPQLQSITLANHSARHWKPEGADREEAERCREKIETMKRVEDFVITSLEPIAGWWTLVLERKLRDHDAIL